jgi:hypothetical protein
MTCVGISLNLNRPIEFPDGPRRRFDPVAMQSLLGNPVLIAASTQRVQASGVFKERVAVRAALRKNWSLALTLPTAANVMFSGSN